MAKKQGQMYQNAKECLLRNENRKDMLMDYQ